MRAPGSAEPLCLQLLGGFRIAHQKDLETQGQLGVNVLNYWLDEQSGTIFCLAEAANRETPNEVHRAAHGLLANQTFEVTEG